MPDNSHPISKVTLLRAGFEPDVPAPDIVFPVSPLRTSAPAVIVINADGRRADGRDE